MNKNTKLTAKWLAGALIAFVFLSAQASAFAAELQTSSRISASVILTDDPFFTADESLEDRQWYLQKIRIPDAWEYSRGSSEIKVAIIDTGIHAAHIELNDGRVIAGYNTVTDESIPANANSDDNGHGTAVAGVIGSIANNARGLAGINWNISLMPVKALSADGTGEVSDVAQAIIWAADNGANIINLSLGGDGFDPNQILAQAITHAYNRGALIVSAAGNDLADQGLNMDQTPIYPICADLGLNMVLGVAATDINDRKASFSNFGSKCVDVAAPGKRILTAAYLPSDPSNNVLIYGSGTSLATPVVSGLAALIKSANPEMSNVEIRDLIIKSADNIDLLNQTACAGGSCTGLIGAGRVNALAALAPKPVVDGSLLRELTSGKIYLIEGTVKRLVSPFVFVQKGFEENDVVVDINNRLITYTTGLPVAPQEGTLVKSPSDPTVYVIHEGLKRPLTYLVFLSRNYSFANVLPVAADELAGYPTGDWYWPPDGTLVLVKGDPTVYVMDQQVRRPVTYFVFTQRKLSFTKVVPVTLDEFSHVPAPKDSYWLSPLDGTLVKSSDDPGIYVIENGQKRLLSAAAFSARSYKFSNVKTLPQAELDVIAPGSPVLN